MTELTIAIPVAAPAEVVWAALTDWTRQGEWMLGTEVHQTGGDGASVGSTLAAFSGVGGIGFLDTMEISVWEPPRRCQVRHTGRLVRGTGDFVVEPMGGQRARLVWSERLDLPLGVLGRLGWFVIRPAFAWGVRRSLQRFATFCGSYQR